MVPTTVPEMARQFPENGMKLLLSNPHNMRDLLALTGSELAQRIDTDGIRLRPTTLVPYPVIDSPPNGDLTQLMLPSPILTCQRSLRILLDTKQF